MSVVGKLQQAEHWMCGETTNHHGFNDEFDVSPTTVCACAQFVFEFIDVVQKTNTREMQS